MDRIGIGIRIMWSETPSRGPIGIRASSPAREVESRLPIKDGRTADGGASGMLGRWSMPLGLIVTDVARAHVCACGSVYCRVYRAAGDSEAEGYTGRATAVERSLTKVYVVRFAIVHRQT